MFEGWGIVQPDGGYKTEKPDKSVELLNKDGLAIFEKDSLVK